MPDASAFISIDHQRCSLDVDSAETYNEPPFYFRSHLLEIFLDQPFHFADIRVRGLLNDGQLSRTPFKAY